MRILFTSLLGIGFTTFALFGQVKHEENNDYIVSHSQDWFEFYKELHASPELSFQEEKTAAKLAGVLRQLAFKVTKGIGGHGVVGVLENGSGPTVMVRTDLDALPVVEDTGLPYASTTLTNDENGNQVGVMHASVATTFI